MTWTAGYVADVGYTYGYYHQLNPLWSRLALLLHGVQPPRVRAACELGFGQGLAIGIHAAAQPQVEWWGTDFIPSQAAFAQSLADACGLPERFFDQSFEEFCSRGDLPDFDYIGLHGIWTWVSDENRALIVDFIRRKLRVGGLLYLSYNTEAGWAETIPLRHLLTQHAISLGAPGENTVARIDAALAFAERLFAVDPKFVLAHPQLREQLQTLHDSSRHYLAHEYFNRDWHPMPFARVAEALAPAKLTYVCSASHPDNVDWLNLTDEQQALLQEIDDPIYRETVRDFIMNRRFRRDCWIKGPLRLSPLEQGEAVLQQSVCLATHPKDVSMQASGALGGVELNPALYEPVLAVLADHAPHSLAEVVDAAAAHGIDMVNVMHAVAVLMGKCDILPVQEDADRTAAVARCAQLNAHLQLKARAGGEVGFLASPASGGGIPVSRYEQLFLLARSHGYPAPIDWARFAWEVLAAQGQEVEGAETPEAAVAELARQAGAFAHKSLPVLQAQGVV